MSNLGYKHLHEENLSPETSRKLWATNCPETPPTEPFTKPLAVCSSNPTNHRDGSRNSNKKQKSMPEKNTIWRPKAENSKYKAMKPTAVKELQECDVEFDGFDCEDTYARTRVKSTERKRMSISKVHVLICGLLIACVIIVAFAVIYVFIILPSYDGQVIYPDGKTHSFETKGLGKNVVITSCGLVQGKNEQGSYVFKGIPYAQPPTGSRRWKSPSPRSSDTDSCWHGVHSATSFGSKCVQPKFDNISAVEGSEDCLYINIWTPSLNPSTRLPVMVWFHSGDFVYGSGDMPGMSPTPQIAVATNSVYVSFNYRLGAFGFLALDALREKHRGAAGNYGFMDQQLALAWVKENIRHFSGNENMVTIFGHGSGATSVLAMLSSTGSSGLFHKAWLTSPVAVLNKTVDQACSDNKIFLETTGCHDAHCLRQLPPDVVSRSSPWPIQAHWTLEQLFSIPRNSQLRNDLPIFDGHVVHLSSQKSGPDGPVVPVIFGSTYFDLSSLETGAAVVNMTWDNYDDMIAHHVGIFGQDAIGKAKSIYSKNESLKYVSPTNFPSAASAQFSHIIGDIKDVCPVKILTDDFVYLYSGSAPVYMYVAEIFPSQYFQMAKNGMEIFVGWDIVAFFDSYQDLHFKIGQEEVNFQNVLREEIMSFVKSNHPDASRWDTADVNVGIFNHDVTVTPVTSEYFGKCNLWKQYQFFKYTWNES